MSSLSQTNVTLRIPGRLLRSSEGQLSSVEAVGIETRPRHSSHLDLGASGAAVGTRSVTLRFIMDYRALTLKCLVLSECPDPQQSVDLFRVPVEAP